MTSVCFNCKVMTRHLVILTRRLTVSSILHLH